MKKVLRHKKRKKIIIFPNKIKILITTAVVFLIFVGLVMFAYQFKPTIETPKTESRKLPADIKKLINQTKQQKLAATIRVPILFYHYVEYVQDKKDTIRQSLNVTPDIFEQQIKTLINANYSFMTAKELGEVFDGKRQLPKNPIILTFDDGHWDFDTVVLPILEKYHVKATVYIIPGFLGGSDFMNTQQMQDVINSGLVDIGAHTVHHVELRGKLFPIVQYEVKESKAMLEQSFHINVVSFAYPSGSFNKQAINVVKEAGFTTAVSTIPGVVQSVQNRFFLYRLRPSYRTGQALLDYLQQNYFNGS